MLECPNCGGNVKFDISSQQVACEFCGTKVDPYFFDKKTSDAQEVQDDDNYEVTIFTCPQCGGEILSTDHAAAGFCSFCGASTILYSRISKEHRPDYIIPFKKTKDDCKQAFSSKMKKALFAPNDLKDPTKIDGFRGIYMPYWAFYETQNGPIRLNAHKSYRRGDYVITDHYELTGNVDSYYKGLSYDASSSFDDDISETLAPYDVKGMKVFTPAYLSGFYADTADVASETYRPEAEKVAFEQTVSKIKGEPAFHGYAMEMAALEQNPQSLHPCTKKVEQAMFPVWFMSYRNGNRIAYATVNGQTGKVVADVPVDMKKFLLGSLALALPLFFLLNLFFTVIPSTSLTIIGLLAVISLFISSVSIVKIAKKEQNSLYGKKKNKWYPIWIVLYLILAVLQMVTMVAFGTMGRSWMWLLILLAGFICETVAFPKLADVPGQKGRVGILSALGGIVFAAAVAAYNPVSDLYYYVAGIILIIGIFITEKEMIEQHNLLSTRRLPQFDKQGGDDRA